MVIVVVYRLEPEAKHIVVSVVESKSATEVYFLPTFVLGIPTPIVISHLVTTTFLFRPIRVPPATGLGT